MPKKNLAIFADHCVHQAVITALRDFGFKIETANEAGLATASDDLLFKYILKTKQTLLTFDSDFGNILRFDIRRSAGVIVVYPNNLLKAELIKMVTDFFAKQYKLPGHLFIVEHNQIRLWPRPVNKKI